jgi:hypothetical protein
VYAKGVTSLKIWIMEPPIPGATRYARYIWIKVVAPFSNSWYDKCVVSGRGVGLVIGAQLVK